MSNSHASLIQSACQETESNLTVKLVYWLYCPCPPARDFGSRVSGIDHRTRRVFSKHTKLCQHSVKLVSYGFIERLRLGLGNDTALRSCWKSIKTNNSHRSYYNQSSKNCAWSAVPVALLRVLSGKSGVKAGKRHLTMSCRT